MAIVHPRADTGACGDNCPELSNLVWGCLATRFAATWVSVHPNVPAPGQGWWKSPLRRLGIMLVAIIAPELIVFFAARQLAVARKLAKRPTPGPEYISDIRTVDGEDLLDKSKGDELSKAALLQGLWFITQMIARFTSRLLTSPLEIATLAYAVVNVFTWALWWFKPQDVKRPIRIGPRERAPSWAPAFDVGPWLSVFTDRHEDDLNVGIPLLKSTAIAVTSTDESRVQVQTPVTRRLIERYPKSETFVWGPIQGAYTHFRAVSSTAVPELWSSPDIPRSSQFAAILVGIVFGAIHCAAWTASFPSALEKVFWRVSAVIVTAYPTALLIPHGLGEILYPGTSTSTYRCSSKSGGFRYMSSLALRCWF
ncbi:hypothetical protein B0H17DRAFT_1215166 [Mycena rosella]|uniref:Uncharacterized protein n=1 Tax=Mycena rosella TaxID=1033263 RepID=A0AAD7G276_MYCRO|nr:hypothetical protein B0H17DRAFT_1215166 [Mycena rosella]